MSDLRAIAKVVAIALACGAALAGANWLTEDQIRLNETAQLRAAIADLLPAGYEAPAIPPEIDRVPGAWMLCSGHLLGRADVSGYGGDIRLLYTLQNAAGGQPRSQRTYRLVRLAVLGHQETPGIADFLTDPEWLSSFANRDPAAIDELSAVTGATITSVAVRDHLATVLREGAGQLGPPAQMACDE